MYCIGLHKFAFRCEPENIVQWSKREGRSLICNTLPVSKSHCNALPYIDLHDISLHLEARLATLLNAERKGGVGLESLEHRGKPGTSGPHPIHTLCRICHKYIHEHRNKHIHERFNKYIHELFQKYIQCELFSEHS